MKSETCVFIDYDYCCKLNDSICEMYMYERLDLEVFCPNYEKKDVKK